MKIKSITTKSGQNIPLNKISILVGANNVGKSQTLGDILQRMEIGVASKSILLDKIVFEKPTTFDDFFTNLELKDSSRNLNAKVIHGIKNNLSQVDTLEFDYENFKQRFERADNIDFFLGKFSKFKVSHLDASSRLQLVKTSLSFNPDTENPQNIIQSLYIQEDNEEMLRQAFEEAFSMSIMLDYSGLKDFCLRVAKEFPEIPKDPREAYKITKEFNKIDNQGDGFRSFVGIILSLLFSKDRIILLDEPEAFLHPAQARFLGKWIADNSSSLEGQLIIATHNANFLNGVLSSDQSIDIYRLNRIEDTTSFNLIPPEATDKLSKSPMLSSQRILEAIFHKGVLVCEADADRTVYQTVSTLEFNNQEILFVHSHNKQTLKDVAKLLLDAKIPVAVVADIDLLNDENDYKKLIETFSGETITEDLLEKRNRIAISINQKADEEILNSLKEDLKEFINQLDANQHTFDGAKGAINRIRSGITKWKEPKEKGIVGFPTDIQDEVRGLLEELKNMNIFLVSVGELEGWMDLGVRKKSKWIIKALDEIFAGNTSEELKGFVNMMIEKISS